MSVNRKRKMSECIICQHRRASRFDRWCPNCETELRSEAAQDDRCQATDAYSHQCRNYAIPNEELCADCLAFYTGRSNGHKTE